MAKNILIAALALTVVFLGGILVGQKSSRESTQIGNSQPALQKGPRLIDEAYWISAEVTEKERMGYATLLELGVGGEVIIEKCVPWTYELPKNGSPGGPKGESCTPVVSGRVINANPQRVTVRDNTGKKTEISFSLKGEGKARRLTLDWPGEHGELMIGSRNDLMMKLEALPSVAKEKQRFLESLAHQAAEAQRAAKKQ